MKQIVLIVAMFALVAAGWLVRMNTVSYVRSQTTALAAAPAGADTTTKLNSLKQYTASHSGATVTVQLTTAYNQAVQAAQAAAAQAAAPSASLYAAAQAACAGHAVSTVQAQCNEQYIEDHSAPTPATLNVSQPKLSDYTYHFVAPFLALDMTTVFWALALILLIVLAWPLLRPRSAF